MDQRATLVILVMAMCSACQQKYTADDFDAAKAGAMITAFHQAVETKDLAALAALTCRGESREAIWAEMEAKSGKKLSPAAKDCMFIQMIRKDVKDVENLAPEDGQAFTAAGKVDREQEGRVLRVRARGDRGWASAQFYTLSNRGVCLGGFDDLNALPGHSRGKEFGDGYFYGCGWDVASGFEFEKAVKKEFRQALEKAARP
jgi:hypothetical protein